MDEFLGGLEPDGHEVDLLAGYFPQVDRATIELMLEQVREHLTGLAEMAHCD